MSRKALVLLVCCCDFRDGAERLIPSKSLRNAVIRAFPGLFRILRMCAPRRAAAVVRPRERKKSADRRRRILISRLLIIRVSVPRRKSPFPAYFKGFPAVSPLIPPYPAFLKYPVSPHHACDPTGIWTTHFHMDQFLPEMRSAGCTPQTDAQPAMKPSLPQYVIWRIRESSSSKRQAACETPLPAKTPSRHCPRTVRPIRRRLYILAQGAYADVLPDPHRWHN